MTTWRCASPHTIEVVVRLTVDEADWDVHHLEARVLSEEVGTPVSAQSVHGCVQRVGAQVEEQELAGSARKDPAPQVVVAELDAPPLRRQEKGERQVFVQLGIGYSQKQRQGPKRWALTDKRVYGGVEEPEEFAERFWVRAEGYFQVTEAAPGVVKGDGSEWIRQGAEAVFPGQVFQLDRGPLLERMEQFAGHLPRLWKRLRGWVYQGRVAACPAPCVNWWAPRPAANRRARSCSPT